MVSLDDKSELAHRIMLANLLRILGAVKNKKANRHFVTRPTQVYRPTMFFFGNDGLYSKVQDIFRLTFQPLELRVDSRNWSNGSYKQHCPRNGELWRPHMLSEEDGIQHPWPNASSVV